MPNNKQILTAPKKARLSDSAFAEVLDKMTFGGGGNKYSYGGGTGYKFDNGLGIDVGGWGADGYGTNVNSLGASAPFLGGKLSANYQNQAIRSMFNKENENIQMRQYSLPQNQVGFKYERKF